jgi:hypothetical protein
MVSRPRSVDYGKSWTLRGVHFLLMFNNNEHLETVNSVTDFVLWSAIMGTQSTDTEHRQMNPYDTATEQTAPSLDDTRTERQANIELSGKFKLTEEQQEIIAKLGG